MNAYQDTRDGAVQCLTDNAAPEVVALAARRVADGTARWRPDPEVAGVWGLVPSTGDQMRALVVVYTADGDFTVSEAFVTEAEGIAAFTLGDLRRATAELPDSTPVHLADAETLRALGEPIVWEGAVYLPVLEPSHPLPSRVAVWMRWADEDRS